MLRYGTREWPVKFKFDAKDDTRVRRQAFNFNPAVTYGVIGDAHEAVEIVSEDYARVPKCGSHEEQPEGYKHAQA